MQGDVCPPTLNCLKQENGSHVCGCEKKGYVVKGDDQERTCEGMTVFVSSIFLMSYFRASLLVRISEWIPEFRALGSGMQLKESQILLTIGIQNPESKI